MVTSARGSRLLSAAVLLSSIALAGPAAAQPAANDAQAQALFTEGRTALEKGDYRTACSKFAQSLALVQRAGTLLNLAQCEQHEGKLVAAAAHWKEGIDLLPPGDERITLSTERLTTLTPRLPHLTVTLSAPAPPGTRIEVDGTAVPLAAVAAGVPIDPGRHVVVLMVPGTADQRSTMELSEGQAHRVSFAIGEAPPPPPTGRTSGLRTAGFAILGVGIAGAIAAGVTGGILVSKNAFITSNCPTHKMCSKDVIDTINGLGPLNVANGISWGAAIAGVAGGLALVLVGGKAPSQAPGQVGSPPPVAVTAGALPGGGGVWMTRSF